MRAPAPHIAFLHPGALDTPTGGYVYDRELIAALRRAGATITTVGLGDGYPAPGAAALAQAGAAFSELAPGTVAVVDGLAFGVLGEVAAAHAGHLRLIALVHHPLAHESGLDRHTAERLVEAERRALGLAAHVIVTSTATARALAASFGVAAERISVIEPALSLALPARGARAPRAPGSPHRLLSVGSLIPRKDHATLLDAVARLAGHDLRLDIVGSAELDPAHAARVADEIARRGLGDRVTLHGALPREALAALYADADLFVLTSLYEGYGMAFAEAMAHGLPVVATGAGAVRDTVPETAGRLCPVGDSAAIAAAIADLLDDANLRARLALAARAHAETLPTWDHQARRLLALLQEFTP